MRLPTTTARGEATLRSPTGLGSTRTVRIVPPSTGSKM
jgi:hypothetical protein